MAKRKMEDYEERALHGNESTDRNRRTKLDRILPVDIIIEILSRTPGSSLVTFRRVCRLWNSLTYDHHLINPHLEHASRVNPRVMIFSRDYNQGHGKIHLTLLDEAWNTRYRLTRASDHVLTTPPCNGLICLYDSHRNAKICNPTTQEFLTLPKGTADSKIVTNPFPRCSIGFHPLTKKYKAVRFFYTHVNHKAATYVLGCEVFTLGSSETWRQIGNIYSYVTGSGINVNGTIYWTTGVVASIPDEIIALDLKSEKFRVIRPPDVLGHGIKVDRSMFLVQLEGNLCLVNVSSGSSAAMDIWRMKGDDDTWIHRCCVPLNWNIGDRTVEPVFIYEGKILIRCGGYLYCHDLGGKRLAVKNVYNDELIGDSAKFYAFVESLVPLTI